VREKSPLLETVFSTFKKFSVMAHKLQIGLRNPKLAPRQVNCWYFLNTMFIVRDGLVLSCLLGKVALGNVQEDLMSSIQNEKALGCSQKEFCTKGLVSMHSKCTVRNNDPEIFLEAWTNSSETARGLE
jgi:hypothetical protein